MIYFIIVFAYNFLQVSSYRQTSPTNRIIREVIDEQQYSMNVNSSFLLQFTNYFGIIDIELSFQNTEDLILVAKDDPYNPSLNHGCRPYDRDIQYKKLFHLIPLIDNETIETMQGNITSLYSSTSNIFILRSDLKLFIMKLQYDQAIQEIVDLQQVSNVNLKTILTNESETLQIQDPVLKCYQNNSQIVYCYVLTQLGTIHFQYNQEEQIMLTYEEIKF